ncbi:hypothetical protein HGP16_12300 [Rhizobium sp. P40RR-XXII]|uniref:hypothetical protein n=1 Tax=unclassified Rhizobium TaxID=2613769 RepID=UPI001456B802|nr:MULTISPECIES: hypothetical protein [unclassified Rhizobium]NLR86668.1 hypothetical protein [Rhizobium sp. P28RR-XV]NLS17340.1 hypothetical protein [Rhizobium sp. P40RR-XXII]
MRSGDVPFAYSSCIRRLTNISKTDMSFTSYIRRKENVALNGAGGKLQFFHDLSGGSEKRPTFPRRSMPGAAFYRSVTDLPLAKCRRIVELKAANRSVVCASLTSVL